MDVPREIVSVDARRPVGVTVVVAILAVGGVSAIASPLYIGYSLGQGGPTATMMEGFLERSLLPLFWQQVWAVLVGLGLLVMGIALGRGVRWSRTLYYIGHPSLMVAGAVIGPVIGWSLALGLAEYLLFVWLLTRPSANAFFAARAEPGWRSRVAPVQVDPARPGGRLRSVASIPFFVLGEHLLFTYALIWYLFLDIGSLMFPLSFFVLPALLLLVVAQWLWGWSRWRTSMGVILVVMGAEAIFTGVAMTLIFKAPEFRQAMQGQEIDPRFLRSIVIGAAVSTLLCLPAGILLLLSGRRRQRALETLTLPESAYPPEKP